MRLVLSIVIAAALAAMAGCGGKDGETTDPEVEPVVEAEKGDAPASIGSAKMKEDGTLVLMLRAEGPGGIIGDAMKVYKPDDPKYKETLEHIGGLKPGEEKPVPPWPEEKKEE